jgi:4-hydroxythreonine-4-phosphate dehydrogenase
VIAIEHPEMAREACQPGARQLVVWTPELADFALGDAKSALDVHALRRVPPGTIDPHAGRAAYAWVTAAARAALAGTIEAVVTAPLHKLALHRAGVAAPGHTEILAQECSAANVAMMLYVPPGGPIGGPHGLGVAHVTLHTSLASVPGLLTPPGVRSTVELLVDFLERIGCQAPRIGVCALNPHAGEQGRFGDEEQQLILPGIRAIRRPSAVVHGPIPADALLRQAIHGDYDGVAAMYHDQGHIAIKLAALHRAVNVTLGLPIVRTSPSHGTAFDIAWQGRADAAGMMGAVKTAVRLAGLH